MTMKMNNDAKEFIAAFQKTVYVVNKYDNNVCKAEIDKLIIMLNFAKEMMNKSVNPQVLMAFVSEFTIAFANQYKGE